MSTRAGRRRKLSLHEPTTVVPESPGAPPQPAAAATTRKRSARRNKENQNGKQEVAPGKFVKFPQDTPAGKKPKRSDTNEKSLRTNKKSTATLTDNNINSEDVVPTEEKIAAVAKVKLGRYTRSKKNISADCVDGNSLNENANNVHGEFCPDISIRTGKKRRNNKAVVESSISSIVTTLEDPTPSAEKVSYYDKSTAGSKKNGRGKKKIQINAISTSEDEKYSMLDTMKTAGSFVAKSSPEMIDKSSTTVNTSVESFHSAVCSPAPLPPPPATYLSLSTNRRRSDRVGNMLDTTFDKPSLDSTITLLEDDTSFAGSTLENKCSISNNVSLGKEPGSDKKDSVNVSTPNDFKMCGKNLLNHKSSSGVSESVHSSISGDSEPALNTTYDKSPEPKSISKEKDNDRGKISEDIFETTLVLVDSSIDSNRSSHNSGTFAPLSDMKVLSPSKKHKPIVEPVSDDIIHTSNEAEQLEKVHVLESKQPKLRREGTFTKISPEFTKDTISPSKAIPCTKGSTDGVTTPLKTRNTLPAPGSTPYHASGSKGRSIERSVSVMNVTRSIEKDRSEERRSSWVGEAARQTRVMFCSPVWNAGSDTERKSKVIKSNLKGSNKSFVYEELSAPQQPSSRKRSYTQNDADDVQAKRKKLAGEELESSISRLSRPKASAAKPAPVDPTTPAKSKPSTPGVSRSEGKSTSARSKLPDFAALHRRQFDKMESLSECQERKAQRARQMLQFPSSGLYTLDGRRSPRVTTVPATIPVPAKPAETKSDPPLKTNNTYTRFGFKMQMDVNPFSIPSKKPFKTSKVIQDKVNANVHTSKFNGTVAQAKITGTIPSLRRGRPMQTLAREKPSAVVAEKRKRETRDIIKGVRTNRRFELQMKSRNVNV